MAKARLEWIFGGLSGSIGDMVFRQMADGSTQVSKKPRRSNRKPSQAQLDVQARFKQAAAYAREASKTQPLYSELSQGKSTSAYNLAFSDWFKAPVVDHIERRDGLVHILASDNVMVTEVHVKIMDSDGNALEQGQAERADSRPKTLVWQFPATNVDGSIEVTACDLAGNQTTAILPAKAL
jgi:hypothetical protein